MPNLLLDRAKQIYSSTPCACVYCRKPLSFYHHDDHICDACLAEQIDAQFDLNNFIPLAVIHGR